MARIRSIKPEFFTSETLAALPISARLTFIGLWTHVDDNGVCPDNDRLIAAAVWPLEENPLEALRRLREDLQRLQEALLIVRYEAAGKKFLFVAGWDEHQKVSHPKKPRFPRPTTGAIAASSRATSNPPEDFPNPPEDDQNLPENLRSDQGAGSREQGADTSAPLDPETFFDVPEAPKPPKPGSDADPDWCAFWSAYPRKDGKAEARTAYVKAISKRGITPEVLQVGAQRYADRMRFEKTERAKIKMAQGWLNNERWTDEDQTIPQQRRKFAWEN